MQWQLCNYACGIKSHTYFPWKPIFPLITHDKEENIRATLADNKIFSCNEVQEIEHKDFFFSLGNLFKMKFVVFAYRDLRLARHPG